MIGSLSMGVFCSWERWSEGLMSGTMCTRGEGGGTVEGFNLEGL